MLEEKYPVAFQKPWFGWDGKLNEYTTWKDERLPTIRLVSSPVLKRVIE